MTKQRWPPDDILKNQLFNSLSQNIEENVLSEVFQHAESDFDFMFAF